MQVVVEAEAIRRAESREFKWRSQVDLPHSAKIRELRMLREEEIRIETGRASHGGDFLRLVHVPTGSERIHPGPLKGVKRHELMQQWLAEIEADLIARGLHQYVVPAYPTKNRWQRG
ncbi:hypothetical protein [Blastopirellula marina]|uniref:Uncharacterized protein n=1 Tax=Blastopirellula marina TaxID=124 RepID=A0A2S8GJV5_9BACT|nr:hypothetical protein [Blastopirellula marina]PQO44728.1 hypothetical protein C5Y93_18365 [Blastopirellula marina]